MALVVVAPFLISAAALASARLRGPAGPRVALRYRGRHSEVTLDSQGAGRVRADDFTPRA